MNYPQARLWLLLLGSLLSRQISWAQDSSVGLNDLNLVLGAEPYSTRDYLLAEMDSFATTHRLHLLITLLDQEDVYTTYARQDEDALLAQAAPALVITTWHQGEGKYYQRCEVQLNEALATRLPQATARQLVEEMLDYYGKGDMMAQDAMNSGLTVALLKLSEYLNALPPPEAVPTITFANAPAVSNQPALGLDAFTDQVHQDHYEQVRINEEPYAVAWKALPSGSTTSVLAQVEKGVSFPPGVVFRQNGNTLSSQPATQNHQQQLTLTGQMHEQEGSLEVYASREEDAALVGKLRTISYDVLYKRLVLVVLDDVTSDMLYLDRVSRAVQATLAQAGVSLTIEIQKFDTEWVDRDVPLNDETTGMLSNYPKELKRVIKDYRQEHEQEAETAYIFLAGSSSTGKLGYMPKKRPYGFVYRNAHYYAKEVAKTIAHELGHGLFRLEHTFEAYPALTKGSTDNLMDYGKGTRLHKYQWDLVHDPKAMLGWFQEQEESASYDFCEVMFQDKLNAIRAANLAKEEEVSFDWSGEAMDCKLWGKKVGALSLEVAHFQMPMRGSVYFRASNYKRTPVAKLANLEGEFVRYEFGDFEYEDDPRVILSVTVMKEQAGELEMFLFGKVKEEEKAEESNEIEKSSNFEKYQKKVFDHEGGFVDDPVDKGGATNKGIIFNTFKLYAKTDLGIEPTLKNLKALTNEQAAVIYQKRFWNPVRADEIKNASLAYALYDFNVNAGNNAAKILQKVLNDMGETLIVDGKIGSKTVEVINSKNSKKLFEKYKQARIDYYQALVNASVAEYKKDHPKATEKDLLKNTQKKYEKGWKKRVNSINYEKD